VPPSTDPLLHTLEALLRIEATDLRSALDQAADVLAAGPMGAEKVDVFLLDEASRSLVALGTSATPLGAKQKELGLDRLPLANGGRAVQVQRTGEPFLSPDSRRDREEVRGLVEELGVRSSMLLPVLIPGRARGVLSIVSTEPGRWDEADLGLGRAIASWVGHVAHRANLVEELRASALTQGRRAAAEEIVVVVAHELRNFLGPLRGRIGLLQQRALREGREADRRDADLANRAVGRVARVLDDLLDVGRIDSGLLALDREPVDVSALAHAVAEELGGTDHEIRVRSPEELVAEADPRRIRHVLENLVSNAVKHSPAGASVLIDVSRVATESGDVLAIAVEDQGPGIGEEIRSRIFERFAKAPGSTGLGLGLYLAREIARAHGGELTAGAGSGGKGTRFELRVPVHARGVGRPGTVV
jgi:signal transduction histidine kinase